MRRLDLRAAAVALSVATVLADSSVVTIALPDVLARYDVSVTAVAWVLIAYNLALALGAVPAAHLARRRPARWAAAGLLVFAGASLGCGLAPSLGALVAFRCVQAAGGALVLGASLDILGARLGSPERAAARWGAAGIAGAALGPAIGGVLTQLAGWESIFIAQAPIPLLALAAVRAGEAPAPGPTAPAGRPHLAANAALLLVSGALSAALFLLAVLLITGWRMAPAAAGLALTIMPLAALSAGALAGRLPPDAGRGAPGAVLVAGGLGALALLPGAGWGWTVLPQVAVGLGLGLTVSSLTHWAMRGRAAQAIHGGWTIGARHAGVVLGLLLLTPIFSADLARDTNRALVAGTAAVLDSPIPPADKLLLAQDVLAAIDRGRGRVPDVGPAIAARAAAAGDPAPYTALGARLEGELDRAATAAFVRSFAVAAILAVAALAVLLARRRGAAR